MYGTSHQLRTILNNDLLEILLSFHPKCFQIVNYSVTRMEQSEICFLVSCNSSMLILINIFNSGRSCSMSSGSIYTAFIQPSWGWSQLLLTCFFLKGFVHIHALHSWTSKLHIDIVFYFIKTTDIKLKYAWVSRLIENNLFLWVLIDHAIIKENSKR